MRVRRLGVVPLLGRRFLFSKASDGFLSFIAWVSIVGVALGVLALTVVTSVINGFEGELVRVITGMNGDVILYSREPFSDAERVVEKIKKVVPESEAITGSFTAELMASGPNGVAGGVIEGVDLETVGSVTVLPRRIVSGRLPQSDQEVVLGSGIASRIGAKEGQKIRLVIPFVEDLEEGDEGRVGAVSAPKAIEVTVSGIAKMGLYEYDSKFMFARLEAVQTWLKQADKLTTFKIRLPRGQTARAVSDRLSDHFGYPFRAKDWSQLNKNLLYAIQLEKVVIAIILTAIIIVAAFNVVSTLMMMIHDKTKEIAILKAMGFKPSQGFRLFCVIGMGIGAVGAGVGVLLGLGINEVLERSRLIELPADIYYIGFLPVVTRWSEVTLIGVLALVICFLATVYPALSVARKSPSEGLRYE